MLIKHTKTILYVDIDAIFYDTPLLAHNFSHDVAVFYKTNGDLLSGTLIFGNTVGAHLVVDEWIKAQLDTPKQWDQTVLKRVINELKSSIDLINLPPEYIKIFDQKVHDTNIIIEHYQASRKYKILSFDHINATNCSTGFSCS